MADLLVFPQETVLRAIDPDEAIERVRDGFVEYAGNGLIIHGNDADPHTDPAIINALRSVNPWIDQADFDHHGYGLVKATGSHFDCTFKRLATIKHRSRETLTSDGYSYRLARGQKSIKGVNGPPA